MTMLVTTYRLVGRRMIPCSGGCGRQLNRKRTFSRQVEGDTTACGETRRRVTAELKAEAEAWQPTGICSVCADVAG